MKPDLLEEGQKVEIISGKYYGREGIVTKVQVGYLQEAWVKLAPKTAGRKSEIVAIRFNNLKLI